LSRRNFIAASAGLASSLVAEQAAAGSLADVPPREPGADLSGHSERSQYVKLSRIPEAGPGKRNVDPADAINSKTPLDKLSATSHRRTCITSAAIPVCPISIRPGTGC
jgi:sulfane dehydrogenase subunit SoxC